jgi:hypothetical protein
LLRPLSEALPHGARGKNYLYNVSLGAVDRYIDSISQFRRNEEKIALYSEKFRGNLNGAFGAGAENFEKSPLAATRKCR